MIEASLGHYRITAKLGQGGMGEVYRATDGKLGREVAIKVLPAEVTGDAERLARFEREAQVLASLNHPGIGAIYGLEEADGKPFLVLELVEGEELAERLARGPLPRDSAIAVARQIAEALAAAHERGIVHRDLKPANVKLTPEGRVKVLDFGLAKALTGDAGDPSPDLSRSPTLSVQATQAGVLLGTAAYMSPEQARGEAVDRRTDIWAFGVVLYEMLTGRRLFQGRTVSDVLASVLKDEPDFGRLPDALGAGVRRALARCLDRDPDRRYRDIADVLLDLDDKDLAPETVTRPKAPLWALGAGVVLAAVLGALLGSWLARDTGSKTPAELRRSLVRVDGFVHAGAAPILSPDGRTIVYNSSDGLRAHRLDRFESTTIPDTLGVEAPFFSPDSERVAFTDRENNMWQVRLDGSERRLICRLPGYDAANAVWLPGDSILFSTFDAGELHRVSARGGEPEPVEPVEIGDRALEAVLPDGRGLLFSSYVSGTVDLWSDGEWSTLVSDPDLISAAYSPTGHVLYQLLVGGLWAVPFDLDSGKPTGGAFQVDPLGGRPAFSTDGRRLLYPRGRDRSELVLTDRDGTVRRAIGAPQNMLQDPSVSPDGRQVAVFSREQGDFAIWLHDIGTEAVRRLTFDILPSWTSPAWGPDGALFIATRQGEIWRKDASGASPATRVIAGIRPHVSGDGRLLVFNDPGDRGTVASAIRYLDLEAPAEIHTFLEGDTPYWWGRLSPDGGWLVYSSLETGRSEVFLRRFPSGEGPWQVSVDGGDQARWSPDGKELFYLRGQELMAAAVETEPGVEIGRPVKLLDLLAPWFKEYAVAPDGDGFVLVRPTSEIDNLAVVDHWLLAFESNGDP